jgi:hypothetical protein
MIREKPSRAREIEMPEDSELDTDRLHESIHEALEKEGGRFLRRIALTTAIFAAFAAVASLQAGATINEALVLKTEATRLQAEASDQWAYYQAKGIKAAVQEVSRTAWQASAKEPPAVFEQTAQRYAREQEDIKTQAEAKERDRDDRSKAADHLLERHHGFANSVALFQIAIALGAVAALTRARPVWWGSVLVGLGAIVLFALQFAR